MEILNQLSLKNINVVLASFDEKIISMYAKGITIRDIQSHVHEVYGADLSPALISNITEKVMEVVTEWQASVSLSRN